MKIHIPEIKYLLITALLLSANLWGVGASIDKVNVYLFPGQGSDYRIFDNLDMGSNFNMIYMDLITPQKDESMKDYASGFIPLIDTNHSFILIGVSLGGMICSELADIIHPDKVILISSAKCNSELPGRYNFQKRIALHKPVPKNVLKKGAIFLQPIVEPDCKDHKEFFRSMLGSKDPLYLKRTINMIINWDKKEYDPKIVHIHGDNDHTIPIKNVSADYVIENGSHMMVYTRAEEISQILIKILDSNPD